MNDGSVSVNGSGDWGLKKMCVEWFDSNSLMYLCDLVLDYDDQQGDYKHYNLQCNQVFPQPGQQRLQTCDEVLSVGF